MENKSFTVKIKEADTLVRVSFFSNIVLYLIVTILSTIHSIDIFTIFNIGTTLAIVTAIAFEIGQVVSLLSLSMLDLTNKFKARFLFYLLTTVQVIGNLYHATAAQLHNFPNGTPINSIPEYLIPISKFIETISFGLLESGSEVLQYIGTILLIILNGSLPIIALLFIENSISFLTKTGNKIKVVKENVKDESFDDIFSIKKSENIIEETQNIEAPDIIASVEIPTDTLPTENTDVLPIETLIDNVDNQIEMTNIQNIIEVEEIVNEKQELTTQSTENTNQDNKQIDKKPKTVRMKVIGGKDQYTFKDIDKSNIPIF